MMYLEHLVANETESTREQSDDSDTLTSFDTLLGIEYVRTLEAFVEDNEEIAKYMDCAPEVAPAHIGLRNLGMYSENLIMDMNVRSCCRIYPENKKDVSEVYCSE